MGIPVRVDLITGHLIGCVGAYLLNEDVQPETAEPGRVKPSLSPGPFE